MKKLLIVLLCVAISSDIAAQQYLNKYLRGDVKTDSLILQAIEGSFSIIRQSYQVKSKKNGSIYGRSGRKDFGHSYSIAVKSEKGVVLTERALKPWLYDSAFKKVEQEYEPVISLTEIRDIENNDSNCFVQYPLQLGKKQPYGLWIANTEHASSSDLEIDFEAGKKDGWILWFMTNKELDIEPNATIEIRTISQKQEINNSELTFGINAPTEMDTILGGIFIRPVFLGGGHVSFRLVGVAIEDGDRWKMCTPFIDFSFGKRKDESRVEEIKKTDDSNDEKELELTPIEKGNKKNKNKKK